MRCERGVPVLRRRVMQTLNAHQVTYYNDQSQKTAKTVSVLPTNE